MSVTNWKDKVSSFKQIDVRGIQGNFFLGLKKQAMDVAAGEGITVIQSFDPIPLYEVMEGLGFEYYTEKKAEGEYHAYFYRVEVKQEEKDIPMRPAALTNMPLIDEKLGDIAVSFWDLTWNDEHRYLFDNLDEGGKEYFLVPTLISIWILLTVRRPKLSSKLEALK